MKTKQILIEIRRDLKSYWPGLVILSVYLVVTQMIFQTVCPIAIVTGFPCPGCGITRATHLILQLKFVDAFCMNLFAYPCIVVLIYFLIRRYLLGKRGFPVLLFGALGLLMTAYWIWRMIRFYPGDAPIAYREYNILSLAVKWLRAGLGK